MTSFLQLKLRNKPTQQIIRKHHHLYLLVLTLAQCLFICISPLYNIDVYEKCIVYLLYVYFSHCHTLCVYICVFKHNMLALHLCFAVKDFTFFSSLSLIAIKLWKNIIFREKKLCPDDIKLLSVDELVDAL